ncbi:MAG: helix-turn-helix domain-containing protein [Clostridiales bacterium]|nr:helix-turn-helix domain-containing protein [Clostridiales bacterium]
MAEFNNLDIFHNNLRHLLSTHGYTQKQLSTLTNTSCASINNYINKNAEPSLSFALKLKDIFGVSVDDLLEIDLSKKTQEKPKKETNLTRFIGSYLMYFYNSGEYKGKVSNFSKNTLKYAVISVVQEDNGSISTLASFIKNRDDAEEIKTRLDNATNTKQKRSIHNEIEGAYKGTIDVSDKQIFIYLKSESLNDQSLIILNNPPSNKEYLGGLGTANSVSRGREHMPCIQFALLSKKILKVSDGEIYNLLSLGVSDVNVETEAEQLINLFKNLYINNETLKDDLTSIQKKKIVENSLNSILSDLIDANMFRFAKVSNMEDDDYYRILKDE